jgi:uncharacterized damage-inducible protein DinB
MDTDILLKLFEHNNWANAQIIRACYKLSDEQLDAEPQSVTKGNIRSTLIHFVTSQQGYLNLLTLPVEQRQTRPEFGFDELQESARRSGEGLLALIRDGKIPTQRLQTTDAYHVEPWVVLVQVINHATEHREQIKSMLSTMGIEPPEIDGWDYGFATNNFVPMADK